MARAANRLTKKKVTDAKHVGSAAYVLFSDGNGLALKVTATGKKSYLLRYMLAGKARKMALGSADDLTIDQARDAAEEARKLLRTGTDPLEHRASEEARQAAEAAHKEANTFSSVAAAYMEGHGKAWSPVHAAQWPSTLRDYVFPVIGGLPVADVTQDHVLTILRPIWHKKKETASRVRGRIERILDLAYARGLRTGENPARRPIITLILGVQGAKADHHPALPYQQMPALIVALRQRERSMSALALEFTILTAARLSEARCSTWAEIDLEAKVWTVPAARMKGRRVHKVPLSGRAVDILASLRPEGVRLADYVFPTKEANKPLSNMAMSMLLRGMNPTWKDAAGEQVTVHGMRSTFRDWCAEQTDVPRELAETALAHTVGSKVEAAYMRSSLFDKRRVLMEDWSEFCGSGKPPKVIDAKASWAALGHVLP